MTRYRDLIRNAVLAVVLGATLVSWTPEAVFGMSGDSLSAGLPLPTVLLLLGLALQALVSSSRPFPLLPWPVALGVMAAAVGLLGTNHLNLGTTARELIQLGEITVAAVWLVQFGTRWHVRAICIRILATLDIALLLLGTAGLLSLLDLSEAKWSAFVIVGAPCAILVLGRRRPWLTVVPGLLAGLAFGHGGPLLVWCGTVSVTGLSLGRRYLPALLAVPLAICVSLLPARIHIWERLSPRYDANHLRRSIIELKLAVASPYRLPFGAGPGQYKGAINRLRAYETETPHPEDKKVPRDGNSQYVVTLVEKGLLGLLGFVMMLFLTATAAFRRHPRNTPSEAEDRRAVACAILAFAGAGVFAITISRGLGIWLGVLLGLAHDPALLPSFRSRLVRFATCWGFVLLMLALSLFVNSPGARLWPSQANRAAGAWYGVPDTASGLRVVVLPDEYAADSRDMVVAEAEDAFEVMPPFVVAKTDGASGGAALSIPEGKGKGIGRATLRLSVPAAGRYAVFARVLWNDGCGNSIALRIGEHDLRLADDLYGRWHQVEGATHLVLPTGGLTVEILNLEDGVMLDFVGLRLLAQEPASSTVPPAR